MANELEQARETANRLNRRVSILEGGVLQMWDACRVDGVRLSRRHDRAWQVVTELGLDQQAKKPPAPAPDLTDAQCAIIARAWLDALKAGNNHRQVAVGAEQRAGEAFRQALAAAQEQR